MHFYAIQVVFYSESATVIRVKFVIPSGKLLISKKYDWNGLGGIRVQAYKESRHKYSVDNNYDQGVCWNDTFDV